jgi:hypothetical protein
MAFDISIHEHKSVSPNSLSLHNEWWLLDAFCKLVDNEIQLVFIIPNDRAVYFYETLQYSSTNSRNSRRPIWAVAQAW